MTARLIEKSDGTPGGEQRTHRWRRTGGLAARVGKAQVFRGEGIQARARETGIAVARQVVGTQRVDHDQDDIGKSVGRLG